MTGRPALVIVGEYVAVDHGTGECTCVADGLAEANGQHEVTCGLSPVIRLDELAALGFVHTEQTELHRRALRAVQRYAHNMPGDVAEIIREALGQSRPEWNRPALRDELIDAALDWAAAEGLAIPAATDRLDEVAGRYRRATAADHG